MRYAYCPLPLTKVIDISVSSILKPFSWSEYNSQYLPWVGGQSLVFFQDPPMVTNITEKDGARPEPICILEVDLSKLPNLQWHSNPSGDGVFEMQKPFPIIPGTIQILVENETMEHEVLYLLRQSNTSKFSEEISKSLVRVSTKSGRQYNTINVSKHVSLDMIEERIFDRLLGVDLLLIASRSLGLALHEWHKLRAFIIELRSRIAIQRTERSMNTVPSAKRNEEVNLIYNIEQQLSHLGALSTRNLLKTLGKSIFNSHQDICERSVDAVFDELLRNGSPRIVNALREEAYTWLARSNENSLLANFARYRIEPNNLELLVDFGKSVRKECDDQDIRNSSDILNKRKDQELLDWPELLSTEKEITNNIINTLTQYRPEIPSAELRKRGVSQVDRNDIIQHVRETLKNQMPELEGSALWNEWELIEKGSHTNFMAYITGRPNLSPILLNFLIFIMNPIDEKRLTQQQTSWNCKIPLLGRAFQVALLGYSSCQGGNFHSLWGAIARDSQFSSRTYLWVERARCRVVDFINNVAQDGGKALSYTVMKEPLSPDQTSLHQNTPEKVLNEQSEGLFRKDALNEDFTSIRIADLLKNYPSGLKKKDIISRLALDETDFKKTIKKLKDTNKVISSGRGGSMKWQLTI